MIFFAITQRLVLLRSLLFFALLSLSQFVFAQTKIWQSIDNEPNTLGIKQINPQKYKLFKLEINSIKSFLKTTPLEYSTAAKSNSSVLELPMPNGSFEEFVIVESSIMEVELAQKFPEIKTYAGYSLKNPATTVRLDFTPRGFHSMILSPEGTFFIDPYNTTTVEYYIAYDKKDYTSKKSFSCEAGQIKQPSIDTPINPSKKLNTPTTIQTPIGDGILRNYRLALAATGEYTVFHGGTVALALAAQVTTMNRVNGIFLKDFAIKMNIIANNNLIIYTNASTDPYTNNSGSTMLTENNNNLNAVIGSANYDIGHVFSTGGGGIAYLQSPCSSIKGGGVTGSSAPIGDAFDVDYVAHEMGHQFGGNHSFNNSCGGNINNGTAFEPGSGTTIMGYAGICPPDIQSHSDAYFHGGNLQEMLNFITGTGNTCATRPSYTNASPTISSYTNSQIIPKGTPFQLNATATDIDGNSTLTYCWEQMDTQVITQPPVSTATGGPVFRSFNPSLSGTRFFPRLSDLVANVSPTWEVLPTVARTLNFRLVVRDNAFGGGYNERIDVVLTVDGNSGPLEVNTPSATGISWPGQSSQAVTWNVANTNLAPVNCSNVDILLSLDGGLTYPITLASNVSNTGTANVTLPNISTNTARILIKGTGRAFFDISNNNFTITCASGNVTVPTGISVSQNSICNGSSVTLTGTCASGTLTWYNQEANGTALGTGSGLVQNPTNTITYYAACELGSCTSIRVATSQLIVMTDPTNYTGNQNNICANSSATLTAICSVGTAKWYDATETSLQATGSPFITPSLTSNTTYKVRCENGSCLSNFANVAVSVSASASAPTGTSNSTICNNTTTTLAATCTTGTPKWYTSNTATLLSSGSSFNTPLLSSNTTYKVRCESGNCASSFVDVIVTVQTAVASPTNVLPSGTTTICANNTVSLSATCAAGTVSWYTSLTGTTSVGTGSPFLLTATATNNYYPACIVNGCLSGRTANAEFNGILSSSDPTFNRPASLSTLSNTSTRYKSHTFTVYQAGSVSLSLEDADGATTNPSTIDSFIFLYGTGGFNPASPLTNLVALNDDISGSNFKSKITTNLAVGTYTVVLSSYSVTPTAGNGDNPFPWTYKMVGLNLGISSVAISVIPAPAPPSGVSVSNTNLCIAAPITLSATCATGTITWYNVATGGTAIGIGNGLSQTPSSSTTYYAACEDTNCKSIRIATNQVTVIQPTNSITTNISEGISVIQATQTIVATNKIISPANVTYKAGNSISLNTGFEAQVGSVFLAQIQGCN